MKTLGKYLIVLAAMFGFGGCSDFLNIVPDNVATIEMVFQRRSEAIKFLATCYSYLPDDGKPASNPGFLGADEMDASTAGKDYFSIRAWNISRGMMNPSSVYLNYWNGANGGKDLYQALRDCNVFIENIDKVPDMEKSEIAQWKAEVKFLKAYYHFYLIRMFGPIPLIKENLPVGAGFEEVKVYRDPLDDCFDYVLGIIEEVLAEENLLEDITVGEVENYGRITREIVLAEKAEIMVYRASPLFSGNSDYANVLDNKGRAIFSPNLSEEQKRQRWIDAKDACIAAIEYCENRGRQLFKAEHDATFFAQDYTDYRKQEIGIRGSLCQTYQDGNNEIIWGGPRSGAAATLTTQSIPRGIDGVNMGASWTGNFAVSINQAMRYYTSNGVPLMEDKFLNLAKMEDLYETQTSDVGTAHQLRYGYETAKFNFNREPRYYAHLGFDGGVWFGFKQGTPENDKSTNSTGLVYLSCKFGQTAANMATNSTNTTGIFAKKLTSYKTVMADYYNISVSNYTFPRIRLTDLYLYAAEALNESGAEMDEVFKYINPIRERAGLESVEVSWITYSNKPDKIKTIDGRREIIRGERTIELAFEGKRFWDVRRWKTAVEELTGPFLGWNIGMSDSDYYSENAVYTRSFTQKDYFWPIADTDIYSNSNLVQNPGW